MGDLDGLSGMEQLSVRDPVNTFGLVFTKVSWSKGGETRFDLVRPIPRVYGERCPPLAARKFGIVLSNNPRIAIKLQQYEEIMQNRCWNRYSVIGVLPAVRHDGGGVSPVFGSSPLGRRTKITQRPSESRLSPAFSGYPAI